MWSSFAVSVLGDGSDNTLMGVLLGATCALEGVVAGRPGVDQSQLAVIPRLKAAKRIAVRDGNPVHLVMVQMESDHAGWQTSRKGEASSP